MSFVYNKAKTKIALGDIHFDTDDIRMALLKQSGSTSADTEDDVEFMDDFTTIGEIVATNYARVTLTGEAVNEDLANNRAEFDFNNPTWSALGGASNDTIGALLLLKFVTNDADSIPIAYIDDGGSSFAQATNGSDFTVNINAEGLLQFS